LAAKGDLQIEVNRGVLVVRVGGSLDEQIGDRFRLEVDAKLEETGAVIVDLGRVCYVDSAGLGLLVATQLLAKRLDKALFLTDVPEVTREILQSSQLSRIFQVRDSVKIALGEVADKAGGETLSREGLGRHGGNET